MPNLFVSHSSTDNEIAQRIVQCLQDDGFRSIFLDFDPDLGIPVGRDWERELYLQLRRADGVLFLSGKKSIASRWCFAELALARALGKPIFPIAIDGAGRHPLLTNLQHLIIPTGINERILDQLRQSLQLSGIDPKVLFSWNPERAPYPGLESFTQEDAAVFFGREREVRNLLDLLNSSSLIGDTRTIVVVGPSGSGKSSLVRAGLIPRLLKMHERWVVIPPVVPGERPLESLARSLTHACSELGIDTGGPILAQYLVENADRIRTICFNLCERAGPSTKTTCLLFIDQLEELLTLSSSSQRKQFLQIMDTLLDSDVPLFLITTLRSEFLDHLLREPRLTRLVDCPSLLSPLDSERLREVIEGPAGQVGLEFSPGLVARIVADTQGGDALPLLNYTLNQLYRKWDSTSYISHEMYDEIGGVVGALQHRANQVVAALERQGLIDFIEPTLLKLASIGRDGHPVRRRVSRSTLSKVENSIVQTFVEARLLKSDGSDREATVEAAHEALLRQWPPLRRAISRAGGDLMTLARFNQLASDWESSGGHTGYLQTGPALLHVLRLTSDRTLSPLEHAYLHASMAYATPSIWRCIIAAAIDLIIAYLILIPEAGIVNTDLLDKYFYLFVATNFIALRAVGYMFGGSPGMRTTELALIARNGGRVTWRQAIIRALLCWTPFSRLSGTVLIRKVVADPF